MMKLPIDRRHKIGKIVFTDSCPEPVSTDTVSLPYGDAVAYIGDPERKPFACELVGPAAALTRCFSPCTHNALAALRARHLAPRKDPVFRRLNTGGAWDSFFRKIKRVARPDLPEQWILRFPARRRAQILKSFWDGGVDPSRISSMIKREVAVFHRNLSFTKPRLIHMPSHYGVQRILGPLIQALSKSIKTLQDSGAGFVYDDGCVRVRVVFACGYNPSALAALVQAAIDEHSVNAPALFYERDGKAWDATMGKRHAVWRQKLYKCKTFDMGGLYAHLQRAFKAKAVFRTKNSLIKYIIDYTTKSGFSDTTLSNSVTNAQIAVEAMVRASVSGTVFVMGDDNLSVLRGTTPLSNVKRLPKIEAKLGIKPEFGIFRSVFDVSFISMYFWDCDGTLVMSPKLGKQFCKLFWTHHRLGAGHQAEHLAGVTTCMQQLLGGHELFAAFIKNMPRTSNPLPSTIPYAISSSPGYVMPNIPDARGQTCRRYGITFAEYDRLIETFASLPPEPCLIGGLAGDIIQRLYEHDTADPADRKRSFG
jgi:hypothetical protein